MKRCQRQQNKFTFRHERIKALLFVIIISIAILSGCKKKMANPDSKQKQVCLHQLQAARGLNRGLKEVLSKTYKYMVFKYANAKDEKQKEALKNQLDTVLALYGSAKAAIIFLNQDLEELQTDSISSLNTSLKSNVNFFNKEIAKYRNSELLIDPIVGSEEYNLNHYSDSLPRLLLIEEVKSMIYLNSTDQIMNYYLNKIPAPSHIEDKSK